MQNQTPLSNRCLLALTGVDVRSYLQGILTNDVQSLQHGQALWAGLLSPQGKYLFDMLVIAPDADMVWLDVEVSQAASLLKRLTLYKLRANVHIQHLDGVSVTALWGTDTPQALPALAPPGEGLLLADPRLPELGWRFYGKVLQATASQDDYDLHRLRLGVPDGVRDILVDKMLWLEANADLLGGVSFTKGCYVGQENTARMHHRGKVRKRLIPVCFEGTLEDESAPIMAGTQEAGRLMSHQQGLGLAFLRLEHLQAELTLGAIRIIPTLPAWLAQVCRAEALAEALEAG